MTLGGEGRNEIQLNAILVIFRFFLSISVFESHFSKFEIMVFFASLVGLTSNRYFC